MRPRLGLTGRAAFRWLGLAVLLGSGFALQGAVASPSLRAVIKPYLDEGYMAGAVTFVASPARVLSIEVHGWSDIARKKPMREDTVFWIASQTKPITGAAVMILVDEGKIDLNAPITKYLPEFKQQWVRAEEGESRVVLKAPRRPIAVRDLLMHTSGMAPYSPIEVPTIDLLPLATRVLSYAMIPLNSEPGERYAYANAGINTAGRIIEVVTGMSYEAFLHERVIKPLGMKDTTFWPDEAQVERLAKSYRPDSKGELEEVKIHSLMYPLSSRQRHAFPGGGLFSTARDIIRFYQMLANDGRHEGRRIISSLSVREMTKDHLPANIRATVWRAGVRQSKGFMRCSRQRQIPNKRYGSMMPTTRLLIFTGRPEFVLNKRSPNSACFAPPILAVPILERTCCPPSEVVEKAPHRGEQGWAASSARRILGAS